MTSIATPSNLFFFYGSLRRGYWNNRILSSAAEYVGPARTLKPFALYIGKQGHVPTCSPNVGETPLQGELWKLNDRDASNVRRLETGYEEGSFEVLLKDGTTHTAFIYHHTDPKACWYLAGGPQLIPSGDYTDAIEKDGSAATSKVA